MCIFYQDPNQVKVLNEKKVELLNKDQEELPKGANRTDLMKYNLNSVHKTVDEIKEEKRNVENESTDKVRYCSV